VPPLKRNQFGATFGGPIKKDSIFFFVDYDGARTRQGTTFNIVVPTAAQLGGDFSDARPIYDPLSTKQNPSNASQFIRDPLVGNIIPASQMAPQAAFFTKYFPAPNTPGSRYTFSPALALDTDKFDIKVSPRISIKDSLVSRYSYANNTESDPAAYP